MSFNNPQVDPTGYTERQSARNKKLLGLGNPQVDEILQEIRSLKSVISEIRLELAKQSQIENKLKNGEVLANSNGGWFWFSS